MKKFRRHSGQVFVLVALSVTIILAFIGLATDVGMLWSSRRKLQTAADAAAVAGANALLTSDSSAYSQAATDVATLNGFTNGQNNTTVTVTEPNPGGSYPSGTYVQVNITQSVPTYFLNVLGYHSIKVTTSALAGNTSSPNTVFAMNGSGNGVTINGANVNVGCGIVSNSSSSSALTVTNGGSVTAASIAVVGGTSGTVPSNVKTNCAPVANPLSSYTPPTPSSCSRQSASNSGTNTINHTCSVSPAVYSGSSGGWGGGGSGCGHVIASPSSHGSYTPISVTFSGGCYGNHISCGGQGQSYCQSATVTLNGGQYQCVHSSGWGSATPGFAYVSNHTWGRTSLFDDSGTLLFDNGDSWDGGIVYVGGGFGGSFNSCSLEVGPNASGCNVSCSSGSYTFLGNVSISGNNTVTLQPGTYYGGITISDDAYGNSPNVTFSTGTYVCGGGGLNVSGGCTLHGSGCTFHNTSDTTGEGYTSGPVSIGANDSDHVSCSLSAPTSGTYKGILCSQDSAIGGSSSWGSGWKWSTGSSNASNCTIKGTSGSTFDGCMYFPNASLTYSGSSSGSGYTIVAADSVTLTGTTSMNVNCNYSSLSSGISPIMTSALYK